jgi:hypothetical protein
MADTADLTFLGKQSEAILAELRELRREVGAVRTLGMQVSEYCRRLEKRVELVDRRIGESNERIGALKDDLELIVKSEIMGSQTHFTTQIEELIESRLDDVKRALPDLIAEAIRKTAADRS